MIAPTFFTRPDAFENLDLFKTRNSHANFQKRQQESKNVYAISSDQWYCFDYPIKNSFTCEQHVSTGSASG